MTTQDMPALPFDRPTILDIPPMLRQLQAERPITKVRTMMGDEAWLVTRYEEAKSLFTDHRLIRSHPDPENAAKVSESAMMGGPVGTYETEDYDHTLMRSLLGGSFSAKRMRMLRPRIGGLVDDLLDEMAKKTPPADLHQELAFPLPVLVICELLGVPYEDRDQFRIWSEGAADMFNGEHSLEQLTELRAYTGSLIEARRTNPGEDVISDIARAYNEGKLNMDYAVGLATGLLFAGHMTTVVLVEFGTLHMLTYPEQRKRLVEDPSLVESAVEEMLRFTDAGGGNFVRYARDEIKMGDVTINFGDAVLISGIAANRDPRFFTDPDTFDVTREPNSHLSFGSGRHLCIGATLARVELEAVFSRLFQRFPNLELAVPVEELELLDNLLPGGLVSLPVKW
ncbi:MULTISPECIES: cytochrome P450 [unclassified Crossiella]|uniref:cytochrome P450 n=1 Tax=Crossiella sp. SN42 TaxID=2944808 RepID=UPI00207C7204|nr:cytochrome P450 [Crossiella sp. SN42]MCO1574513.1 cytochrome P450 [Crossiella sp. SN42]